MTKSSPERFEGVELLRFVLSLGVVIFHYYFWAPQKHLIDYASGSNPMVFLMFGVEAFFAASGFVIVLSAAGRKPLEFLTARAARLGPTLLVASSITLSLYFLLDMKPRVDGAGLEYFRSILFFPLARLGSGLDPSLWSLTFEIRFYILIFVCMFFLDVRKSALWMAIALLAYDFARTSLPVLIHHPFPTRLDYFKTYASFFVIGMLLYHRHVKGRSEPLWIAAMLAALALAAVRATTLLDNMFNLSLHLGAVHLWQGALVSLSILVLMVLAMQPVRSTVACRAFRVLGRSSYPLYVIHQLCGYWILNYCDERLHLNVDLRPPVMLVMLVLALAFGNWAEPTLIRHYKKVLVDATRILSIAIPPRLGRTDKAPSQQATGIAAVNGPRFK